MEESRTKKASRNLVYSIGYRLVDVALSFILRSVFIRELGIYYLGVSGLFTSILNVLSLMELGVGSAIAFSLYRPLAEKDQGKIAALMRLYKKTYTVIGLLVLGIGFGLTPFLHKLVNLPEDVDNLYLIYWLSVTGTASSYFLAYRRTLISADQRSDICTKVDILFRLTRFLGLVLALLVTKNYLCYLVFDILNGLACNIVISRIVKARYPYIEAKEAPPLESAEKRNIVKYISATILQKFGQTVVTSTDSIIISALLGTSLVGYYSNYYMLYANLNIVVYMLFSNLTASVGNYAVTHDESESYGLFRKLNLTNYMIVCTISVCYYCLASPFIVIWLGEQYILPGLTVGIISLNFYITSFQNCIGNFLGSIGELNYRNRFTALTEGVVNLVASILLVKYTDLGLTAVFLGTTICFICGRMWMEARVLFKYWFKLPLWAYFQSYLPRFALFAVLCFTLKLATDFVFAHMGVGIVTWTLCGFFCVGSCGAVFFLLWRKTEEFRYLTNLISRITGILRPRDR